MIYINKNNRWDLDYLVNIWRGNIQNDLVLRNIKWGVDWSVLRKEYKIIGKSNSEVNKSAVLRGLKAS